MWSLGEIQPFSTSTNLNEADDESDAQIMVELQLDSSRERAEAVDFLVSVTGGRAWAFHVSVLAENRLHSGEFFDATGKPFTSDAGHHDCCPVAFATATGGLNCTANKRSCLCVCLSVCVCLFVRVCGWCHRADWIRRWLTSTRRVYLSRRSFVGFHALTDVNADGSLFPWLSGIPIPL
jgi:hypothetical protein